MYVISSLENGLFGRYSGFANSQITLRLIFQRVSRFPDFGNYSTDFSTALASTTIVGVFGKVQDGKFAGDRVISAEKFVWQGYEPLVTKNVRFCGLALHNVGSALIFYFTGARLQLTILLRALNETLRNLDALISL